MNIYNFVKPGEKLKGIVKVQVLSPEESMIKVKVIRLDKEISEIKLPIKDGNFYRNRKSQKNP